MNKWSLQTVGMLASACMMMVSCRSGIPGREWRLVETVDRYVATELQVGAEASVEGGGVEIRPEQGCLVIRGRASAYDQMDTTRIYECTERASVRLAVDEGDRFRISDPAGAEYPGVTRRARVDEVPAQVQRPSGLVAQELPASRYPVRVEWQVVAGEASRWIDDPNDYDVILARSFEILRDDQKSFRVQLCRPELDKLMAVPLPEFRVLFRVSTLDWNDAGKSAAPKVIYLRSSISRAMVESELRAASGRRGN